MTDQRSRFLSRLRGNDEGVALVAVVGLSIIMLLLAAMALSFSARGMVKARNDQDWNAALSAAYAGVDEYSSRLSNDSTYQRFGNPAAPFTIATGSAATVDMPAVGDENEAFGTGVSGTWGGVVGTSGRAAFRYEVDNSQYSSSGIVRIRSTGKVGQVTRSIVANLKQKGFIDFLYFTDYELSDPQITGSTTCTTAQITYAPHNSHCTEIQFGTDDFFYGPVHSNDRLRICGSNFSEGVSTSTTLSPKFVNTCSDPISWGVGSAPSYSAPLTLPPTNGAMANETRVDLPDDVPRPGCMYTGPTTITFLPSGQMRVVSPWTKFTRPSLTTGIGSQNPVECGVLADLNSTAGALVTVPNQNLIFVQTVPPAATDPNSWTGTPAGFSCTGSGTTSGWKFGTVQYPLTGEVVPPTSTSALPAYQCQRGDAFVQGQVKGAVTVAADTFIYATSNITYVDPASDMLGLVGQDAVWVWNPMTSCSYSGGIRDDCTPMTSIGAPPAGNREIDAAILSVGHTFQVQNYDTGLGGRRGVLTVIGAIAQTYRGTAGTSGSNPTGYTKNYHYDTRLKETAPPKFLAPTSTTYGVTQYVDVATAFKADGSVIP
ncbi:hypothetical protein [Cryobacterium arcticum]|uniref:Uncharacterized protein n=1 Tax=Cryobacterium arcticum TaxID=670052 RepID=A0A1B1BMV5_9MICO|nr:hypothetical protein [Cryobacterium arcticum]ANP73949.1 hypothetical protein PA27867_3013 [Cryobacterium arcticum]